ncbi:glycine cleavage system aminomethyltransferase GcvT [Candidatus Saganbacteria bacterium]|nr:glycine cleavage system aminomethyltransferase GcvT [Candidatus Saganbacteria bacterium]
MLKRTPLYEEHLALGAKMVPFAGWEMPVSYPSGIIAEHLAVRSNVGIFDIGHMGVIDLSGTETLAFIQYIATNDASLLSENECQYSILCNESGGAIDDILVYRLKDRYRIVANASNTDKVLAHFNEQVKKFAGINIEHRSGLAMQSLQGPKAKDIAPELSGLKHNHCADWKGMSVSRTGYTGEDGFEFFVPKENSVEVWRGFIDRKVQPCGLGSRDTLRLEAGLPLYGHEYNDAVGPLEVGYSWAVKFEKGDFIGKAALKNRMVGKKLVGLKLSEKAVPREGYLIKVGGKVVGQVSSGTFSPTLKTPAALAFIDKEFSRKGQAVEIEIRGNLYPAVVSAKKLV